MGLTQLDVRSCIGDPPSRIRPALELLLEAVDYAEQTGHNGWDFAVELERLSELSLTLNDFRWLVCNGLVEHRQEITHDTDNGRAFRLSGDLSFPDRTCFILTADGVLYAKRCCSGLASCVPGNEKRVSLSSGNNIERIAFQGLTTNQNLPSGLVRPSWDAERRLLQINGLTVKHFKWKAENQEAILSAFEEERWPWKIDDPLPPHPDQESKRRLSDTIKCLNRKQRNSVIHFRGDGTGEGIVWEFVDANERGSVDS